VSYLVPVSTILTCPVLFPYHTHVPLPPPKNLICSLTNFTPYNYYSSGKFKNLNLQPLTSTKHYFLISSLFANSHSPKRSKKSFLLGYHHQNHSRSFSIMDVGMSVFDNLPSMEIQTRKSYSLVYTSFILSILSQWPLLIDSLISQQAMKCVHHLLSVSHNKKPGIDYITSMKA
jgi:hypothetical protein